jgi:hypothetical protein
MFNRKIVKEFCIEPIVNFKTLQDKIFIETVGKDKGRLTSLETKTTVPGDKDIKLLKIVDNLCLVEYCSYDANAHRRI